VTIGHNPNNPSSPDKGKQGDEFNVFTVPGTLEVVEQKGRHLDLMYRSAYGQTRYIGTISADASSSSLPVFIVPRSFISKAIACLVAVKVVALTERLNIGPEIIQHGAQSLLQNDKFLFIDKV